MSETVTMLLERMRGGDPEAREALYAAAYDELRRLAGRQVARFNPDRTLNATVLVHELFLKLDSSASLVPKDRRHLIAVATTAMRQIAVDYARHQRREKRGGNQRPVALDDLDRQVAIDGETADSVVAIDRALAKLGSFDERLARVVEMRFFGGLSVEETAEALGVSTPTVKRDTRVAKAFLQRELSSSSCGD